MTQPQNVSNYLSDPENPGSDKLHTCAKSVQLFRTNTLTTNENTKNKNHCASARAQRCWRVQSRSNHKIRQAGQNKF